LGASIIALSRLIALTYRAGPSLFASAIRAVL